MLASCVRPERTSLPITRTQAVGLDIYRKSLSKGMSGLSAGGMS